MASGLDGGIRLATQAVQQDARKNYAEAARCYREAVVIFRTEASRPGSRCSKRVRQAIEEKCALYEARLKKLDRHLLGQADLSSLFRNCVEAELKKEEGGRTSRSSYSSEEGCSSVDSEILAENPFLKRGLDTIDRAKKEDAKCHLAEALQLYEQGAGQLLDALRKNGHHTTTNTTQGERDQVRIKCLLVHDRCELIREHLDSGAPLQVRKHPLDSLENSLEGSPENSGSPIPVFAEDRTLDMDEARSDAASLRSVDVDDGVINVDLDGPTVTAVKIANASHSSLYPTCQIEIKRSDSAMSGNSDFLVHNGGGVNGYPVEPVILEDRKGEQATSPIPLASVDSELQLSALSIEGGRAIRSSSRNNSRGSSIGCSVENLQQQHRSTHSLDHLLNNSSGGSNGSRSESRSESRLDTLLVLDEHGKLSVSSQEASLDGGQADRNVTELTFANSPFKEPTSASPVDPAAAAVVLDSGSDSGFSDPSPEGTMREKTPTEEEDEPDVAVDTRKSPLSDIDSIDIVPSLPQPSPDQFQQQQQPPREKSASSSSSSSPTPASTAARRRRSNRSTGSSVKIDPAEDRVVLLSEETVYDPDVVAVANASSPAKARAASPERYAYTRATPETRARERTAYVPPRSMAARLNEDDDEEDINKGCYYFMACLDSFWIL